MENNKKVEKLISKKKKNFLHLVFSRLGIIIVLLLLQISMLIGFYGLLTNYLPYFNVIQTIFSIGMVFYLFNSSMDSSAKLTWLFIIMLMPIPGAIMLLYTQIDIGHTALKKRTMQIIDESKNDFRQDEEILNSSLLMESGTSDLYRFLNRSGCFPIYTNTEVTFFPFGQNKFDVLLNELKEAKKFIYLEYFIIEEGYMWGKILNILADKASEGVDVRVMYDGMCEISTLSMDYAERMNKLGIKCKAFSPITPFVSTHYNYRDHRKILVIDGRTAFNGGVNLADEYINKKKRFGYWKDTAIMLKGEAVWSFTLMFLQMWNITEKEVDWSGLDVFEKVDNTKGFVMPYNDSPFNDEKVGESVYMDILNRASNYVYIMTPYLILDGEMEMALKFAAKRGIDVKLILPGIPDKKYAFSLAKSHYKSLLEAGIRIFEYTPGFVHAKEFICDDVKAVVGTINLDYRSLYHHFECATYMYGTDCIKDIKADFQNTLSECREITYETIKEEKLYYKIMGGIIKVIAPLL